MERSFPFKFVDGFGLDSKTVGIILSLQGVYQMLVNLLLTPRVLKCLVELGPSRIVGVSRMCRYLGGGRVL